MDDKTLRALARGVGSLSLVRKIPHIKERQQPDAMAEAGSAWLVV